jgi:5'-AMP-activated protein kinase catalytic alpha subunit
MKVVDFPALVAVFSDYGITADTLEANLMREIEIMRTLRHRNIIHLEGSFWVDEKLYIGMELVEGKDLLRSVPPGGLKEDLARDYFFQLCSAVSFCHSNNVSSLSVKLS